MDDYVDGILGDNEKLLEVMPYLSRHLDGDLTAWDEFAQDKLGLLNHGEKNMSIDDTACCEQPDLVYQTDTNVQVCRGCGLTRNLCHTSFAAKKEAIWQLSRVNTTYERRNHWNEFMNCVLCREATFLPDALLQDLDESDYPVHTINDVKMVLRHKKRQKYYKNVYRLYLYMKNKLPFVLSSENQNELLSMFRGCEQAWLRLYVGRSSRRNFVRNGFLLGMFARVLLLRYPLEKTTWEPIILHFVPKLPHTHSSCMKIWSAIADDMKWTYLRATYKTS